MGAKEYDVSLMVAFATSALDKLVPVCKLSHPHAANAHFLADYEWTEDSDVDVADLGDYLKETLFKVDPTVLTTMLQIATDTRQQMNTTCQLHGCNHEIQPRLDAAIETAEVTKKRKHHFSTSRNLSGRAHEAKTGFEKGGRIRVRPHFVIQVPRIGATCYFFHCREACSKVCKSISRRLNSNASRVSSEAAADV